MIPKAVNVPANGMDVSLLLSMFIAPVVKIGELPVTCSVIQVIRSPCPALAASAVDNPVTLDCAIGAEALIVPCFADSAVDNPVTLDCAIGAEALIVPCFADNAVDSPVTFESTIGAESLIVFCFADKPDDKAPVVA